MKRRILSCFLAGCFFLFSLSTFGQSPWPQNIPDNTEFSLLTTSPGNRVHNIFGHSALRMRNDSLGIDYVFNWGTFDYKVDYFVPKFILGTLPYSLSRVNYKRFEASYKRQDRSISQLTLNLSETQKQKLNSLLLENYKKENRKYRYDFFYDNCSTRIRDLIEETYGTELQGPPQEMTSSFKDLLQDYLTRDKWMRLGINLILGKKASDNVDFRSAMFLPQYLEDNLKVAKANNVSASESVKTIYRGSNSRKVGPLSPLIPGVILLLIGLIALFRGRFLGGGMHWLDKMFFSVLGIAGWLFVFMWLGTKHIATYQNAHLLWALPIYLPLVWFMKGKALRRLMIVAAVLIAVYLVLSLFNDMYLNVLNSPSIPILIAFVLVRIFYYIRIPKTT